MSFILDALKKSESDRQRQSGPALFEVKVAPPRARWPLWALALVALLVVNVGVVAWMMLRHPDRAAAGAVTSPSAAVGTTPSVPPPPVVPASAVAPAPPPALAANTPAAAPPAPSPATTAASSSAALSSPEPSSAAPQSGSSAAPVTTAATATAATAAAVAAGAAAAGGSANPEDYAPAQEPAAGGGFGSHVRRGTAAGVPLYQEAAATTQIPQLRLDLHVFAQAPQDRFVMINMHKLREGDSLPEGVHVDSITPDGAVLSYNGSKFLLPRD